MFVILVKVLSYASFHPELSFGFASILQEGHSQSSRWRFQAAFVHRPFDTFIAISIGMPSSKKARWKLSWMARSNMSAPVRSLSFPAAWYSGGGMQATIVRSDG